MIALRIGPDFHQALVGAPSYFARQEAAGYAPRPDPLMPASIYDCPRREASWSWPFVKGGRDLKVRAEGPLAFNAIPLILSAALAGLGLAYLPEEMWCSNT